MSQAEAGSWMSFPLYHLWRLRTSTKVVRIPVLDMNLKLKLWCLTMTAHSVQAELLWDAWKINLSLFLGRAPMIFQMTCSFGFLPHSSSVPWRQSFFTEKFDLLPITAFVEIIPLLTDPRWAGLPCWRMLWVWLQAQHLSLLLLMDLIFFLISLYFSLCCLLIQAKFYLYDKHEWASPPLAQLEISFISNSALLPFHGAEIKLIPTPSLCNTGRDMEPRKTENTWAIIEPENIF